MNKRRVHQQHLVALIPHMELAVIHGHLLPRNTALQQILLFMGKPSTPMESAVAYNAKQSNSMSRLLEDDEMAPSFSAVIFLCCNSLANRFYRNPTDNHLNHIPNHTLSLPRALICSKGKCFSPKSLQSITYSDCRLQHFYCICQWRALIQGATPKD